MRGLQIANAESVPLYPIIMALLLYVHFLVIFLFGLASKSKADICKKSVCEYDFTITYSRTMTYFKDNARYNLQFNGTRLQVVENSYHRNGMADMIGKMVNVDDVITADGFPRDIITINDQFPGPTIEVMEGAQVGMSFCSFTLQ